MTDGGRPVRIIGVPTDVFVRSQEHVDELLHELELVQVGADAGVATPPAKLRQLMDEILDGYTEARHAAWAQSEAARSSGRSRFDLVVTVPREAAAAGMRLVTLLEQADELSRGRHLLTVPAPAEVVALRQWMAQEMAAQLEASAPPTPCPL